MHGAKSRVQTLLDGGVPDHPPLYDLVRNDAVLSHFAGQPVEPENGEELVFRVLSHIIDVTRPRIRAPEEEREEYLPDGRRVRYLRWTTWTEERSFPDSQSYAGDLRRRMESPEWSAADDRSLQQYLQTHRDLQEQVGDDMYLVWSSPAHVGLQGMTGEVGLERFSYLFYDCPEVIPEWIEWVTKKGIERIRRLPDDVEIGCVMLGEDVAFKTGTFLPSAWMNEEFIPRIARIVSALHDKGIKVLFHSDGNLNAILPGLVEAGIDVLNPVEILAGMNPGEIHRRFPDLILAGAIDVSQLLPHGSPQEIRRTVRETIAQTEGRIMVGSSTELHAGVPLENYLALRDAVLEYGVVA